MSAPKITWGRHKIDHKIHEKNEMPPVMFVGNLKKTHTVLRSKIADVHLIEIHSVRTCLFSEKIRKFVCFRKIFHFYYR